MAHSFELLHGLNKAFASEDLCFIPLAGCDPHVSQESLEVLLGLLAGFVLVLDKVEKCHGGKELGLEADFVTEVRVVLAQALAHCARFKRFLEKQGNLRAHIRLKLKVLLRARDL